MRRESRVGVHGGEQPGHAGEKEGVEEESDVEEPTSVRLPLHLQVGQTDGMREERDTPESDHGVEAEEAASETDVRGGVGVRHG